MIERMVDRSMEKGVKDTSKTRGKANVKGETIMMLGTAQIKYRMSTSEREMCDKVWTVSVLILLRRF